MMNLTLYKMTCEQIRVNKTSYLTQVTQLTGNLREPSDLINPSITIEYSGLPLANYAYISGFGRYYFITNITSICDNKKDIILKMMIFTNHENKKLIMI